MTPLRRQAFSPARNAGDCQFDCRGGADQMSIYYDINDIDDQSPEHRVHHRPRVVPPEWESRDSAGKAWVWMWEPASARFDPGDGRLVRLGDLSGGPACLFRSRLSLALREFNQLNRSTIVDDHCRPYTARRRADVTQHCASLERLFEVIHLKCNMGNCANQIMHLAFGLEAHPLNTVRTRVETAHKNLQMLEMVFTGVGN